MDKSCFGRIWTKLDANLDYFDKGQTLGNTGFFNKTFIFGKKIRKILWRGLRKFFLLIRYFDVQSLINSVGMVFVSAYPKSNFESNFWISQCQPSPSFCLNIHIYFFLWNSWIKPCSVGAHFILESHKGIWVWAEPILFFFFAYAKKKK